MAWSRYLHEILLVDRCFALIGCLVAERAGQASAVEPCDVVDAAATRRCAGHGCWSRYSPFERGEETLGERGVAALPGAPDRERDLEVGGEGGVLTAGETTPAIGGEDQPAARIAGGDALHSASATSSVRRCSAIANPTTLARRRRSTLRVRSSPARSGTYVMSPHQRALSAAALVVKSRGTKSCRGARVGERRLLPPLQCSAAQPRLAHEPGDALAAAPARGCGAARRVCVAHNGGPSSPHART